MREPGSRAKAFTCSSGINEQKSRILTTEITEFTEDAWQSTRERVKRIIAA
jgi:hypothetical protein